MEQASRIQKDKFKNIILYANEHKSELKSYMNDERVQSMKMLIIAWNKKEKNIQVSNANVGFMHTDSKLWNKLPRIQHLLTVSIQQVVELDQQSDCRSICKNLSV